MKANRETIVLIAAACAMTFALSHHAQTTPEAAALPRASAPQQDWTGHLAQVAPAAPAIPVEPMSSASLVVPKSAMALPAPPRKIPAKTAVPAPPTRNTQVASITPASSATSTGLSQDHSLLHTINPLNHLPDMAVVRRPFAYAGETVAGWFRHF